jgi:hypothetical protein
MYKSSVVARLTVSPQILEIHQSEDAGIPVCPTNFANAPLTRKSDAAVPFLASSPGTCSTRCQAVLQAKSIPLSGVAPMGKGAD